MRYFFSFFIVLLLLLPLPLPLSGQSYEGWVKRSADFIEVNRFDSAAFALQKAMSLDPVNENNPVLLLNLGIMQRQLKLYDDAYISFTASLANNPLVDVALHNRASLLCDMDRLDEAMEDYNTIIRLYPENVEAYYRRGLLFLEKSDRKKAEADFKASEDIDAGNIFTKLSGALLYKLDDDWEAAERVYSELIKSESMPDPIFYMNRAECYLNIGQLFKASADLRAIGESQKDNPYFYVLRGRVRLGQFDKVAAKADFIKAEELGYDVVILAGWMKKTE
ncbi:MAG: tetratricopeptide repeat protein [Proteiniphilum sp.]|nr:tetratricopeptide repeat protein [Proteiniphilum sp.]